MPNPISVPATSQAAVSQISDSDTGSEISAQASSLPGSTVSTVPSRRSSISSTSSSRRSSTASIESDDSEDRVLFQKNKDQDQQKVLKSDFESEFSNGTEISPRVVANWKKQEVTSAINDKTNLIALGSFFIAGGLAGGTIATLNALDQNVTVGNMSQLESTVLIALIAAVIAAGVIKLVGELVGNSAGNKAFDTAYKEAESYKKTIQDDEPSCSTATCS